MSKAVFLFTFFRIAKPANLFHLLLFIIGIPAFIAYGVNQIGDASTQIIPMMTTLLGPVLTMLMAYTFVSNITGNAKSLHDGEYMALLFSRPLRRSSYIFSKWLAGSTLVFLVVLAQMFLLKLSLHTIGYGNLYKITFIDVINVGANSLGTTALIVLLHAFPPKVGISLLISLLYLSFMIPIFFETSLGQSGPGGILAQTVVNAACGVLRGFFSFTFDIESYLNSIKIFWLPAISFVSNVTLYLWLAIVVMNKREFFYANE